MTPLPTVLLTGFLGAGKTTLLNHLLTGLRRQPDRLCLLINEFGRIGLDSGLVSAGPETIHEVNAGSIFCVCTRDRFLEALDRAAGAAPPFDLLLIEATGVAATSDLGSYIYGPPIAGRVRVVQNICVVDAANFHKVRATLPAAVNQVEEATDLVINKTDLVSAETRRALGESLRELNPRAALHTAVHGAIESDRLLRHRESTVSWRARSPLASCPPSLVVSANLTLEGVAEPAALDAFLESLPGSLLRGKGVLALPDGPVYLEWVGERWTRRTLADRADARAGCLVLIGPDLDEEDLQVRFRACRRKAKAGQP